MKYAVVALLQRRVDSINHNLHRGCSHRFHRLPNGAQGWSGQSRGSSIVEANDRTLLGHFDSCLDKGAQSTERADIVEGHQRSEGTMTAQHFFGQMAGGFKRF